jgi:5-histidylcysteine sulfoxide synthase
MPSGHTQVIKSVTTNTFQEQPQLSTQATLFSRTPDLRNENQTELRQQLRHYFVSTFDCYESLFECLTSDQAFYVKPINLRHPLIFYYGHTATFFVNKLLLTRMISKRINQRFESMFAVGVDEMSWDDLNEAHYNWPTPAEVKIYRDQVRSLVLDLIDNAPLELPVDWDNPWWTIIMGIEHERIHLETSSVLIRQHKLEFVNPSGNWQASTETSTAPINKFLAVPAGSAELSKEKNNNYYGWDNEYGYHQADIAEFQASQFLVSNFEFCEFVEAGGYLNSHNWEDEGKHWLNFTKARKVGIYD